VLALVGDGVVGRLVRGGVDELVVTPAGGVLIGGLVGNLHAQRVVHHALLRVGAESDDVVLAWGTQLAGVPLKYDPLIGSGKAATDLRIRLVRSMPNQGLSVEGRAETRLRGSQANRQGDELSLGLLIRRGSEMDLPGRHGGGAAVPDI